MKNLLFFVPVLILLLFTTLGSKLFASGGVSPTTVVIIMAAIMTVMVLVKPKKKAGAPVSDIEEKVRGDFARDAFSDNPQLQAKFLSALKDYSGNMPKSALTKLTKLAPLCTKDPEIYAVSLATAHCQLAVNKPLPAVREYTRALGLHPTSRVAKELGSCHQRLGSLDKAIDSYQFALDLDPENLEARSVLATAYVADGDYETGLEEARAVLTKDEKNASALATAAICSGLMADSLMQKHYTQRAVDNGYSEKKINDTIAALKKRK